MEVLSFQSAFFNDLKEAFIKIYPSQKLEYVIPTNDDVNAYLKLKNDLIAFVKLESDPQEQYKVSYKNFTDYIRKEIYDTSKVNPIHVIFRSNNNPVDDSFYNKLENDIYFCKKYVIALENKSLDENLLSLPFLPLDNNPILPIIRPPSAQTFLQEMNISGLLARKLIKPQEAAAKTIISEFLDRKFDLPDLNTKLEKENDRQTHITDNVRIKKIEISGFRAYRKKQVFDLDADIVILYGPNGLGKTSFFDAIDYVSTGRIGRLTGKKKMNQKEFIEISKHLNSELSESLISLTINKGEDDLVLAKRVDNWNIAYLNNHQIDRKQAIQFITSMSIENMHIDILEQLFRASHLFGQTDPELLIEFNKKCSLSKEIFIRMLALDDYSSGLLKLELILTEIKKLRNLKNQDIEELHKEINDLQQQINKFPQDERVELNNNLINNLIETINYDIFNLDFGELMNRRLSIDTLFEWQSITDSKINENSEKLKIQYDILNELPIYNENLKKINNTKLSIRNTLNDINLIKEKKEFDKINIDFFDEQIKNKILELKQIATDLERLSEFDRLNLHIRGFKNQLDEITKEEDKVYIEIKSINVQIKDKIGRKQINDQRIHDLNIQCINIKEKISLFEQIEYEVKSSTRNKERLNNTNSKIIEVEDQLKNTKSQIELLTKSLSQHLNDKEILKVELNKLTKDNYKLTKLLNEIEEFVIDQKCPTCGAEHHTKAALLASIEYQKEKLPLLAEEITKKISFVNTEIDSIASSIDVFEVSEKKIENQLALLKKEVNELYSSQQKFENLILRANNLLNGDYQLDNNVDHLDTLHSEINIITNEIASLTSENSSINSQLINLNLQIKEIQDINLELISAKAKIIDQLRIRNEELSHYEDITNNVKNIEEAKTALISIKTIKETDLLDLKNKHSQNLNNLEQKEHKINDLQILVKEYTKTEEFFKKELEAFRFLIKDITVEEEPKQETFASKIKQLENENFALNKLKRQLIDIQIMLDLSSKNALVANLEFQKNELESELAKLQEELKKIITLNTWVCNVKERLEVQSQSFMAEHLQVLSPLSSIIQQRLRSVYGFSPIKMDTDGDDISVSVNWGDINVKPVDYFSDSQKQMIMLSIFLSCHISQTWSGFSTIFLDDPVTHFDDLNAYGFVELIKGIVTNSPKKRQFFISTCELRLFEMMQKKFRDIPGQTRFYKFEGIGSDGPLISSLKN